MSAGRFLRSLRYGAAPLAICMALQPFGACAGLEADAEAGAGQRPGLVLAQAAAGPERQAATSPYMKPAPRLFEATGTAVWDGRRTLQGIWVAHPLATTARRVRIFDTEHGTAVDGALFRRDPSLTGPDVLISSEAAKILGMKPDEAVELRIVALAPKQSAATVAESLPTGSTATAAAADTAGDTGAAAGEQAAASTQAQAPGSAKAESSEDETALVTAQAAATPEAPVEEELPAAATPETQVASAPEAQSESGPSAATAAPAEQAPFDVGESVAASAPEPEPDAAAAQEEPSASPAMQATTEPGAEVAEDLDSWSSLSPAESAGQGAAAAPPGAAEAPQSPDAAPPAPVAMLVAPAAPKGSFRQSEPAPARPARPATQQPSGERVASAGPDRTFRLDEPASAAMPAPQANPTADEQKASAGPDTTSRPDERAPQRMASAAPAGKATPPAGASPLDKPYVQAGLFGVADNATRLIARIEAADLPALGKPMTLGGRPVTRVLAGPFDTVAERAAALRTIRRMGLADALPVAR